MTRQNSLPLAALLLSALMFAVVPLVTTASSPLAGYVGVLATYWICFCVPIALVYGRGPARVAVSLDAGKAWIPATALALPVFVLFAAGLENWLGAEPHILALALLCALINGPLEEFAWRRPFRANSDGRLEYELLGLCLFTLWHVPLYFSKGVSFDYGAAGLIGGALVLGAVWALMTRASDSIGWPIVCHTLTNVAAFLPFFASNFGE